MSSFFVIHGQPHFLSHEAAQHVCWLSPSVSVEPPVTELEKSFKKEKEAMPTNNWTKCKCYNSKYSNTFSRFSYRTLTLAEFQSLLQHCSPAITDALLHLWPHHSRCLRPLWCTGSLTVCGLQTDRRNALPHSLEVWDPS